MNSEDAFLTEIAADADVAEAPMSRAERRDVQVQRILQAARACFKSHGFHGASMQQICTAAEMSPGALYRYFPSKEAIVEMISEADRRDDVEIFERMFRTENVAEGLVGGIMDHVRHIHQSGNSALFAEIRAESLRNPNICNFCIAHMDEVMGHLRGYIQSGVDRGQLDPVVDIDTLLALMMAMGEGLAINDLPAQGVDLDKLEAVVRASINAWLRPVAARTN